MFAIDLFDFVMVGLAVELHVLIAVACHDVDLVSKKNWYMVNACCATAL